MSTTAELDAAPVRDRQRAAKAVQAVRATYIEDIAKTNRAIGATTDPAEAEALRRVRTILVGISAGLDTAAAQLVGEES